jgi:hypothetical protein
MQKVQVGDPITKGLGAVHFIKSLHTQKTTFWAVPACQLFLCLTLTLRCESLRSGVSHYGA